MAFSTIAASDVDADSPITDTLMGTIRTNFDDHESRIVSIEGNVSGYDAGDVLMVSLDTEKITTSTTWAKRGEFTIGRTGVLRIKFAFKTNTGAVTVYCEIRRNGSLVGSTQSRAANSYLTISQDISGWSIGDTCEIWLKTGSTSQNAYQKNFRIYIDPPEAMVLSTDV